MMHHHFPSDREIVLTRRMRAPRERVFAAFTAPNVDAWWGPDGFTTVTERRDCRVGGEWIFTMSHAEYGAFPNRIRYEEIVAPSRLAYLHDGGPDDPVGGFRTVITFAEVGDETDVSLHTTFPTAAACAEAKRYQAVECGFQTLQHCATSLGVP